MEDRDRMKSVTRLVLAAAVLAPLPALAETPEEAVAYAFFGLESGGELTRGPMQLTWRQAASSPAMFVGHGEGGGHAYDVTFTITAIGDDGCAYEVQLAGPPGMVRGGKTLYAEIALDRIEQIASEGFYSTFEGDGFCQTGERNPTCTVVHRTDLFGALDPDKHARLVGELAALCPAE